MPRVINHLEMKIKPKVSYSSIPIILATVKKPERTKCWHGYKEAEILVHCGKCCGVRLEIQSIYNPAILFWVYTQKF